MRKAPLSAHIRSPVGPSSTRQRPAVSWDGGRWSLAVLVVLFPGFLAGLHGRQQQATALDSGADLVSRYAALGPAGITLVDLPEARAILMSGPAGPVGPSYSDTSERRFRLAGMLPLELMATTHAVDWALVELGCQTVRRGPRDEFQRTWLLASLALMGRLDRLYDTRVSAHLDHISSGLPDEPRVRLARLLVRPEVYSRSNRPVPRDIIAKTRERGMVAPVFLGPPGRIRQTERDLQRLSGDANVGSEARAHLALLRLLLGKPAESLADAREAAEGSRDPVVRNLAWLTAGLALDLTGRRPEATEAYRAAVTAAPSAKASATMLAVHEFLADRRASATATLNHAYQSANAVVDAWHRPLPDDRFLPHYLTMLRDAVGVPQTAPRRGGSGQPAKKGETVGGAMPSGVPQTPTHDAPGSTFTARVSGVVVDVSVQFGNTPVAGLTASDFEVLDNGVRQTVHSTTIDTMPLDVSVILDMTILGSASSGSSRHLRQKWQ